MHFRHAADGHRCVEQMNGFQIGSRAIRVSISNQETSAAPMNTSVAASLAAGTYPGLTAAAGTPSHALRAPTTAGSNEGPSLDSLDDGHQGGKVTAAQRASIMAKLAVNAGVDLPDETKKAAQSAGGLTSAAAALAAGSRCVVLKNMFDRLCDEAQSNPKFFTELADDVRGECAKLGTVLHAAADKWSNGFVYVKMMSQPEAVRVLEKMNGRYFAQNRIIATHVDEQTYDKKMKLR